MEEKKIERITVRFKEEEYEQLKSYADEVRRTPSDFIRQAVYFYIETIKKTRL